MLDKICEGLMNTKCEKDRYYRHCWERIGVISTGVEADTVWQCSQCHLCVLENLKFIGEDSLNTGSGKK